MSNRLIRRAGPEDLDDVLAICRRFYAVGGHEFDGDVFRSAFAELLGQERYGLVLVAEAGDEIVGYGVLTWGFSLESGGRDVVLDQLYVDEPGKGLGSELLDRLMAAARLAGARRVYLATERSNQRARAFYQRHGFVVGSSIWMNRTLVDEQGAARS